MFRLTQYSKTIHLRRSYNKLFVSVIYQREESLSVSNIHRFFRKSKKRSRPNMMNEQPQNTTTDNKLANGDAVNTSNTDTAMENDIQNAPKIFSTSRPKDALDGMGKGVGNVLKGALGGAAMMLSAPVAGAYSGGQKDGTFGAVKGFGIGLGMGILGGTAMIIGGVCTGTYQIGRGIYNTPEAVSSRSKGMEWDDFKKEWIVYSLEEEANMILNKSDEEYMMENSPHKGTAEEQEAATKAASEKKREAKVVSDLEFYEVLDVPSNASPSDIKKAYYIKAKQHHPDRHPNDPNAHSKFQKIGEAYQVLSDEKLRANYDARGKEGVEDAPKMDSSALFSIIFGSEKFEPLIGELKVASYMQQAMSQANGQTAEEPPLLSKFRQRKREVQCAVNLVAKLQPYVDSNGNIEAYQALLLDEVKELSSSPIASSLLSMIGLSYLEYAKQESSTFESMNIGFQQASRGFMTRMNIAGSGISAALKARELQKVQERIIAASSKQDNHDQVKDADGNVTTLSEEEQNRRLENIMRGQVQGSVDEQDFAKKVEEISGQMFSMIWSVTEIDIRNTLAKICHKVIHDRSVDDQTRMLRLQALRILGEVFCKSGVSKEEGMKDLMAKLGMKGGPPASAAAAEATATAGAETNHDVHHDNEKSKAQQTSNASATSSTKAPPPSATQGKAAEFNDYID